MAENKKVQIKNTGGDALYPRTAAENIVNVPGGTMNVFMFLHGIGDSSQFPDPPQGARYFDPAANGGGGAVYESVSSGTWTGKTEITSWDWNTLFFWNGSVYKYVNGEDTLKPAMWAEVSNEATNGVRLDGGGSGGMTLKALASSAGANQFGTVKTDATVTNGASLVNTNGSIKATVSSATGTQFGTVKTDATVTNGASLVNTNGSIKATVSSATATQLGTVKVATATANGVALAIANGAVSATQTFATNAEASAGSIASKGVTPAAMKYARTWTAITDKGTSATVTISPGGVYKVTPASGLTLSTTAVSANMYGADARLALYMPNGGTLTAVTPLVLVDPVTPGAGNYYVAKYRDGNAYLYKEGVEGGYFVNNYSNNNANSLYYAINTQKSPWIYVQGEAGHTMDFGGTLSSNTNIVGNGCCCLLAGSQNLGGKTLRITEAELHSATFSSGTLVLAGTVYLDGTTTIGTGAYVQVAPGVSLQGKYGEGNERGTIDLLGTKQFRFGAGAECSHLTISRSKSSDEGPIIASAGTFTDVTFDHCWGNRSGFCVAYAEDGVASLTNCTIVGCTESEASYIVGNGSDEFSVLTMSGCICSGNIVQGGGNGGFLCTSAARNRPCEIKDCEFLDNKVFSGTAQTVLTGSGGAVVIAESTCGDTPLTRGNYYNKFDGCTFSGNKAASGGAVAAADYGVATFVHCNIVNNKANSGGAFFVNDTGANCLYFSDCVISGNSDTAGSTGLGCIVSGGNVHFDTCRLGGSIAISSAVRGGCVLLTGSNTFATGNPDEDGGYRPLISGGTVFISAGAIVDAQAQGGYLMDCASVQVGSGNNPFDYLDGDWTVGGSATLITSNGVKKLIGSGNIIDADAGGSNALIYD